MNVFFLRHGVTDYNRDYLFQGQIDVSLNAEGRQQAEDEGRHVRAAGLSFDKVYCSPLGRAVETCELVTGIPRQGYILDKRLAEIAYGPFEGKPIMASDEAMWAFLKDPYHVEPPEGVESFRSLQARMIEALADILRQQKGIGSVLISSHGIALSTLFQKICEDNGIDPKGKNMAEHGRLYRSEFHRGKLSVPELVFPAYGRFL